MTTKTEKKATTDNFMQRYIASDEQRKETSDNLKRIRKSKAGRKPIPEEEKREKNRVSIYVNQEELEIIKEFVGDRSASDVIRSLVLEAATAK